MRALAVVATVIWLSLGRVLAHGGGPGEQGVSWTFDPWIVTPLATFGALYTAGSIAFFRRSRRRRPHYWQVVLCLGGWLSLAGALVSPLHALGEQLFTFHMIEHEIIMAVSAPLLVLANPVGTLLWSLPHSLRILVGRAMRRAALTRCWQWVTEGSHATVIHGIAIWAWHWPALFDATISNIAIHRLQHVSFLLSAVFFWWSVFRRSEAGAPAWHVFVTMLHTSVLGALMALALRVLYTTQTANSLAWGLTPLEDQQLAGIIMWVPAGTIYAAAVLVLVVIWINQAGVRTRRSDVASAV
ncbi:MAG: cytochrome c oxidase assembly protein [Bradyrhizobium sp.]|nr:cytochrome c oxidase assembly protein [Bradyrhizobium sp.]